MQDNQFYIRIQKDDEVAFSLLFDRYYNSLCNFAFGFSISKEVAEEIVSDVFFKLWENRKKTEIAFVRAFLYTSVKNKVINTIKADSSIFNLRIDDLAEDAFENYNQEALLVIKEDVELAKKIIDSMPLKRRTIFKLNRIDGLKYKEIAIILNISVFTVQNQMVEAVKYLYAKYPNKKIT